VGGDFVLAARLADAADAPLRATLTTKPDDAEALVMLARVISQCRIPGAELMQQGALSAEAVELLARALELRPRDWLARYLLALHHFRAPGFMNRSAAAAREFDVLLTQQGEATTPEIFARPFEYRGLLWLRVHERDSARIVWAHGLRLFPSDSALQERMRGLAGGAPPRDSSRSTATPSAMQAVVVRAAASDPGRAGTARGQRTDVLMSPGAAADVLQAIQLQGGATLAGDAADLHARR
jgi:tetratricopeptide (TPR) repeat protein